MNRYLISLLLSLMAPAMVFPMGLENDPELLNRDAKEKEAKVIQQEKQKKKAYYPLDCFSDDVFRLITEYVPLEDKIPNRLFPLPGTKFEVLPKNRLGIRAEFNSKTKRISEYNLFNGKALRIYDTARNVLCTLEHQDRISLAKFNEDGTRILTISHLEDFCAVHIWDIGTGKQLYSFSNNTAIYDANFNPTNSDQIVIACSDKIVRICDITTQQIVHTLQHDINVYRYISYAIFHPNKPLVATVLGDTIFLWDITTEKVSHTFEADNPGMNYIKIAFSADGAHLIASMNISIKVWDMATFALERSMQFNKPIYSVALNADGSLALIGFNNAIERILDVRNNRIIYEFQQHTQAALSVSFDDNDHAITSDSDEGLIIAWDLKPFKQLAKGKFTQNQYKFLNLLAQYDEYCTNTLMPRIQRTIDRYSIFDRGSLSLSIRNQLAALKLRWDAEIDFARYHALYPLDLSILARKHKIPVQDLRKALDSFDPEVKQYIIKKYNIKTDWFYWCTRPAVLYSAAGAVAGAAAYLGLKLFRR